MSTPDNIAADVALKLLKNGNERFMTEVAHHVQSLQKVELLARFGQKPFATVITCADSRVAPEVIFHCGLGDIFVIRNAGNVIDSTVLASIEYAALHLGTRLIVVMGHTHCGAIGSACDANEGHGHGDTELIHLLAQIQPCVDTARTQIDSMSELKALTTDLHIKASVEKVKNYKALCEVPDLMIVGAKYETDTGTVIFDI